MSFEKIQGILCIFQIWIEFGAQIFKLCKIHRKSGLNNCNYCFANISQTKAQILIKFYAVVNNKPHFFAPPPSLYVCVYLGAVYMCEIVYKCILGCVIPL